MLKKVWFIWRNWSCVHQAAGWMCQSGFFPSGNIHPWEVHLPKKQHGRGWHGWVALLWLQVRDAGVGL